jgi:transcriptional regulator with XRE-family HTH domain
VGGTVGMDASTLRGDSELLARALRSARETLGISQEHWGSLLGVSMNTIARWETHNVKRRIVPSLHTLVCYREILKRPSFRAELSKRPDVVTLLAAATLLPPDMVGG